MSTQKKVLTGLLAALTAVAGVFSFVPQARVFIEPTLVGLRLAQGEVNKMPDLCPLTVCGYDAKTGTNSLRGPVGFPDGGAACLCE